MSGFTLNALRWVKIAGPTLAIDTTGGAAVPNVRADPDGISIWQTAGSPRQWQVWTGIDAGWSGVYDFPADYAGPVGWFGGTVDPVNPSFAGAEFETGVAAGTAFRVHRVFGDGSSYAPSAWWPPQAYWDAGFSAAIAMDNAFTDTLQQIFPSADPLDAGMPLYFVTEADPYHLWLPFSLGWGGGIESALLAFNPSSGMPDYCVLLDIQAESFLQNFGRAIFLCDGAGNISFNPSAQNVAGQLFYNAPASSYQAAVLDFWDFVFSKSGAGPIVTNVDAEDVSVIYGPLAQVDVRASNGASTRYFPNDGIPGYAWSSVPDLTGAEVQQLGACNIDPVSAPGGVHDALAAVSPLRDPNTYDLLGIVYTPYWQGNQGVPVGVAFPEDAVAPFYGMVWRGGVYLLDSATPTQMFALTFLSASFAGLYDLQNWVRMG